MTVAFWVATAHILGHPNAPHRLLQLCLYVICTAVCERDICVRVSGAKAKKRPATTTTSTTPYALFAIWSSDLTPGRTEVACSSQAKADSGKKGLDARRHAAAWQGGEGWMKLAQWFGWVAEARGENTSRPIAPTAEKPSKGPKQ